MDPSLLRLMEELLEAIEQRESCDPDAPKPDAARRVRALEDELTRRLADVSAATALASSAVEPELAAVG